MWQPAATPWLDTLGSADTRSIRRADLNLWAAHLRLTRPVLTHYDKPVRMSTASAHPLWVRPLLPHLYHNRTDAAPCTNIPDTAEHPAAIAAHLCTREITTA